MAENYSIDDELDRYDYALSLRNANIPYSKSTANVVRYNPARKVDEVFMEMKGGGHVKIAEQEIDPITDLKRYDTTLRDAGQSPTIDDYYAAGFDDDQINQAGLMPQERQPGRTEPLSDYEKLYVKRQGGELLQEGPSQPLFDNAISEVTKGLVRGGLVRPSQFLKDNFNIYDPLVFQVVDPQTGEFDPQIKFLSREEKAALDQKIAAGEMPYAIDFEQLVSTSEASGAGAQVLGDLSQFVGAFAGLGKLFKVGSGIVGGATQGAAADFLAFRGDEGRITDLLLELGVPENRVTDFLKTDPNDPDYVGRFKTALEGGPIGVIMDTGLLAIGKTFRAIKDGDVVPDVLKDAIAKGKDALGETFLNKVKGIEAWHGSPADFDKFSLKFMGTGEGNQTFGRGLYFAQARQVAEEYRKNLTSKYGFDEGKGGKLYQVKINADPNDFVNWDAPLENQPERVKEILSPYIEKRTDDLVKAGLELVGKYPDFVPKTREDLKKNLRIADILWLDRLEGGGEIVKELTEAGVPGIRYFDEASREQRFEVRLSVKGQPYPTEPIFARNKAQAEKIAADYQAKGYGVTIDDRSMSDTGTRNFVVFDDDLIDIVAKYGFAGLFVGAAVQADLTEKQGAKGI